MLEPDGPALLSPTWNVFSAARQRCNIYCAQNQIVKSLSKLIDKTTRHGVPHLGTGRVDGALRRPDHGQRANQDLSSLDDGTAKRVVRPMASVPAVCPSKHRIAAHPDQKRRCSATEIENAR